MTVGSTGGRAGGGGGGVASESDGNSDAVLPDCGAALRTEDEVAEGVVEGAGAGAVTAGVAVRAGAITVGAVTPDAEGVAEVAGVADVAVRARRADREGLFAAAGFAESGAALWTPCE
jgi:hypothetical protein